MEFNDGGFQTKGVNATYKGEGLSTVWEKHAFVSRRLEALQDKSNTFNRQWNGDLVKLASCS